MRRALRSYGPVFSRLAWDGRLFTMAIVPCLLFACTEQSVAGQDDYAGEKVANGATIYPGMWRADSEDFGLLMLSLADGPNGSVVGMMLDGGQNQFTVAIWPEQGRMVGGLKGNGGQQLALRVQLKDELLYLDVHGFDEQGQVLENGSRVIFSRHDSAASGKQQPAIEPQRPREQVAPQVTGSSTVQQLQNYLSGRHMLLSWIDGGGVFGKYHFLNTHFCSSGRYAVYAETRKKSVISNMVQRGGWEVHGTWRVVEQDGQVGISYQPDNAEVEFLPLQWTSNGPIAFDPNEFTPQGAAEC